MSFKIAKAQVQKVHEMDLNGMTLAQLLPPLDRHVPSVHPEWIPPGTSDDEGHAFLSLHSWLVRHEGRVILIDAGAGNDKPRPEQKVLDHLHNPYLAALAAASSNAGHFSRRRLRDDGRRSNRDGERSS